MGNTRTMNGIVFGQTCTERVNPLPIIGCAIDGHQSAQIQKGLF